MNQNQAADHLIRQGRNRRLLALGATAALGMLAFATYWTLHASHFVSTDNAYAAVEIAQITSTVGGIVAKVEVRDTQQVSQGDALVTLDQTDARLALEQAQAELDRAIRRFRSQVATDVNLGAQIVAREADEQRSAAQLAAAQADFERAQTDLKRRQALVDSGSVSGEELTRAQHAHAAAQAGVASAKAAVAQSMANLKAAIAARDANAALISDTTQENHPEVEVTRARLAQARLDLERTVVRAPVAGVVAKRQVQLGQRVQPGVPLLTVVPLDQMHVDANFKEVQLQKVRVGQPVTLHADLYGKDVTFHGVVEGFSGGSGAAFAAIPAQNATGNWIKVVQRLPVRIRLDPAELQAHPLRVGLSMSAEIDTRSIRQ